MAKFLRFVSALYVILVWLALAVVVSMPAVASTLGPATELVAFFIAVSLSIPATALFAFAQVVEDIRSVRRNVRLQRDHLEAMLAHYEPQLHSHSPRP